MGAGGSENAISSPLKSPCSFPFCICLNNKYKDGHSTAVQVTGRKKNLLLRLEAFRVYKGLGQNSQYPVGTQITEYMALASILKGSRS